jgi:hypothetical protein
MLVAHAGGGLPDRTYTNSIEALDLAYAHGLRIFEIDFLTLPFGSIAVGHDLSDLLRRGRASVPAILDWMRAHPDARLVTDFKTDNVEGLRHLSRMASDLAGRIIPQIYRPSEYRPIMDLGFAPPIFTLYRNDDPRWLEFANSTDLFAVTMPASWAGKAKAVRQAVFLHTIDEPADLDGVVGLYTNCLVPAEPEQRAGARLQSG